MRPFDAQASGRLVVGLDLPSVKDAERIVALLGERAGTYKIGYRLAFSGGLELARDLARDGRSVFLDLKLHDIGNTVEQAVESVLRLGVSMLTVHAYPQVMEAAARAAKGSDLLVLAVTVLTSLDEADLEAAGYRGTVGELVRRRAAQARAAGIGGIVAAAAEAAALRAEIGPAMAIVTPGIRPAGEVAGDQKRVATPAEALRAGASHLVVARPVIEAADPRAAADRILAEMADALPAYG